jgi:F0F1-type ATP synthase membrane subunit b/b'
MQKTFKHEDIEQILAEADELLQQIDPEIIAYMEEEQRIQLEQQAQSLKKLKSEVQDKIGKQGAPESSTYSEGVHEAIEDIVKAMTGLTSYLS